MIFSRNLPRRLRPRTPRNPCRGNQAGLSSTFDRVAKDLARLLLGVLLGIRVLARSKQTGPYSKGRAPSARPSGLNSRTGSRDQ